MTSPTVLIVGTRPEAIKMIPLYFAFKRLQMPIVLCSTAQHSDLLKEVYTLFGVKPDYEFDIMRHNQDLFYITTTVLQKTKELFNSINPNLVLVQGDTTSSMAAALSAFYLEIPIGHIEAGLRTWDIKNPYPEEINRQFIGKITNYHFAPTSQAVANLLAEGIDRSYIYCTGNTVVDALRLIREQLDTHQLMVDPTIERVVQEAKADGKKIVLLTLHRREHFKGGLVRILNAIKTFANQNKDVLIIYPFHPNPHVLDAVDTVEIAKVPNVYLSRAVPYKDLVYLLSACDWVATDSGGIQEETISIGKKVLVLRDKTERVEGLWTGIASLVGTQHDAIIKAMQDAFAAPDLPSKASNVYGDGYAADMIARIVLNTRGNTPMPQKILGALKVASI